MSKKRIGIVLVVATSAFLILALENTKDSKLIQNTGLDNKIQAFLQNFSNDEFSDKKLGKEELFAVDKGVTKEFESWYVSEAAEVESSQDFFAKDRQLRAVVKTFSAAEFEYIKDKLLAEKSSANDKILASYILQISWEKSIETLVEVAKAPLSRQGDFPVHSPQETLAMQEQALRRMVIDGLFERAKEDLEFRARMPGVIEQISDEKLRGYAMSRYRKLYGP